MKQIIDNGLNRLKSAGNMRYIPADGNASRCIDFSSNDYLGIASRTDLRDVFFDKYSPSDFIMSASASRLLARRQSAFDEFERVLSDAYGREALLFNSGYHANTGLVAALATTDCTIVADKLVHASIIDGIKLSGQPFERFRHNDMNHLSALCRKVASQGRKIFIIAESVYSMDGDHAPLDEIIEIKRKYSEAILYVDEAHAVGVEGPAGLGLTYALGEKAKYVDVVVGTLGKALGSAGAFALTDKTIRDWAINRARSFIFSTALPPITAMWSKFVFEKSLGMDSERQHLKLLGRLLGEILGSGSSSHIQPYVLGDPKRAVAMSERLKREGFEVLPIRTPTVPPGTDRLRISLSATIKAEEVEALGLAIKKYENE